MAYVVKKFSMGYDFEGISYIIFTDAKTAYEDIIQSIGRGTRSDKGELGTNVDKKLIVDIPIYLDDEEDEEEYKYEYKKLTQVLRFLMFDLELKWYDILKKIKKRVKRIKRERTRNEIFR